MRSFTRKPNPSAQDLSAAAVAPATVLVVDDSPTETRILMNMLVKAGYRVETATNGEEGVEAARRIRPDVILMDVIMPVLNGYQATRQLKRDAATAEIPIIMVTTKDMETDKTWGMRQGANDYLVKPVDRQVLLARIQSLLDA